MATNGEKARALDLENVEASQSEEEIREAAQTDKVVRGVNGGLTPKARKLRPLAGLIIISLVVLAAAYMRHGLANRNKKAAKQSDAAKIGVGPATSVENGMLSDQARNGLGYRTVCMAPSRPGRGLPSRDRSGRRNSDQPRSLLLNTGSPLSRPP